MLQKADVVYPTDFARPRVEWRGRVWPWLKSVAAWLWAWIVGTSIRGTTKALGEPKTKTPHVLIVEDPINRLGIEQTSPRQQRCSLDKYEHYQVWRRIDLTAEDADRIVAAATADIGKRYGFTKILLFLADALIGKLLSLVPWLAHQFLYRPIMALFGRKTELWYGWEFPLFANLMFFPAIVCSQAVAWYYWKEAEVHFGDRWQVQNPDSMLDHSEQSHKWEKVMEK